MEQCQCQLLLQPQPDPAAAAIPLLLSKLGAQDSHQNDYAPFGVQVLFELVLCRSKELQGLLLPTYPRPSKFSLKSKDTSLFNTSHEPYLAGGYC